MMATMKAVRFDKKGPVREVLRVVDVPKPTVPPGSCLVKILASAINPSDAKNIEGLFPHTVPPLIPGRDFAGKIVQGPAELIGKAVWGTGGQNGFGRDGTHAEYIDIPISTIQEKPTNLSFSEAAAVALPYITASAMFQNLSPLPAAGSPVLVLGSSGAVGSACVALLTLAGLKPIKTSSKEGVQGALWTGTEDFTGELKKLVGAEEVAGVMDCVGDAALFNKALFSISQGGHYVTITAPKENNHAITFNLLQLYRKELHLDGVNTVVISASAAAATLASFRAAFESGALPAPKDVVEVPMEDPEGVLEAFESVARVKPFRGKKGKLVVVYKDE